MTNSLAHDFAVRLAANGVTLKVRNGRLWIQPARAYGEMSDEDRAIIRHHRAELKSIAAGGMPAVPLAVPTPRRKPRPQPTPEEPEPEVYVYDNRITSTDVVETLKAQGDQALADYHAGRTTKAEAYEMARHRLRQILEIGAPR